MKLVVSPRAQADIDDIWEYTVRRWGERQAEAYIGLIKEGVDAIAENPAVGRPCDDVRPGYRRYLVGSHVLFYRVRTDDVAVIRILHQRMDVERHL